MKNRYNKILLIFLAVLFIFNLPQGFASSQEFVPDELIVKFKTYVPEDDISVSAYRENRNALLKAQMSSDSIEALKKKYGVTEEGGVFKETEFINLNNEDSEISKALNKAFPGFEEKFRGNSYSEISEMDLSSIHRFKLSKGSDILAAAREFSQDPDVEYAEPNYIRKILMAPNDPYYYKKGSWGQSYDDLWGLKKIRCGQAWDISQGDGVRIAIVDTGIDYNHEDIAENIWINKSEIPNNDIDDDHNGYVDDYRGYDFSNKDNEPMDDHGHGTHVAGIIASVGNNNIGVIGVSPKAKVMAIKGLDSSGSGNDVVLANCLKYGADNGGQVINNSWGGRGASLFIEDVVKYAYSKGCVITAAAGNDNSDVSNFTPANISYVIAVSAVDNNDKKALFSNWGAKIDVAAPGIGILSLRAKATDMYGNRTHIVGEKYYYANGTSMACPYVSGLAALVLSRYPEYSNVQVRSRICSTSIDLGSKGKDNYYGYGRVDAYAALQTVVAVPPAIPPAAPIVRDTGKFTSNKSRLYASWNSSDSISGISEYQYRIISGPVVIRDWTSRGNANYVNAIGLNLMDGGTYYFEVKARNGANLWSQPGSSDGITVDITAPSIENKTSSPQRTNSAVIFRARITDKVSNVRSAYLVVYKGSGPRLNIRGYFYMGYDSATGLYQARLSPGNYAQNIPYKIISQDNAGNTSQTSIIYLRVISNRARP